MKISPVTRSSTPLFFATQVKPKFAIAAVVALVAGVACGGCGGPNKANVVVRKENQQLRMQVKELQRARDADAAMMRVMQEKSGAQPTLPPDRLEQLFTTHGLRLGKLTGGFDTDPAKAGDELLKVYVVPTDRSGDLLKAAGSFVVELFDLAGGDEVRIGKWEFAATDTPSMWFGQILSYGYVLPCPWQAAPQHGDLTVKVTFTDSLTGRAFTEQKQIKVQPSVGT